MLYSGGQQPEEKVDSCPKAISSTDDQWARYFKGEFLGYIGGGVRGYMQNSTVSSDSLLETGHVVVLSVSS